MTKNFEYTDIDGIKKEAAAFVASEFVSVASPFSPVMTGLDGRLNESLMPLTPVAKASSLVIRRKAQVPILRGDLVRASIPSYVTIADSNIDSVSSRVLGIALEDSDVDGELEILLLGTMIDPIFSGFLPDDVLFLDEQGGVTNERPTLPSRKYLTIVEKALGGNEILIQIETAKTLGA